MSLFYPAAAAPGGYNWAMRIYLDGTVARWLRQAFGRPFSFDEEGDAHQWSRIDDRLQADEHGAYLELSKADPSLLEWFIRQLIVKGWGRTYGRAFRRIATQIAEHEGASAIDRLSELVREQQIKPVKLGRRSPRERAVDKIANRKRGPE